MDVDFANPRKENPSVGLMPTMKMVYPDLDTIVGLKTTKVKTRVRNTMGILENQKLPGPYPMGDEDYPKPPGYFKETLLIRFPVEPLYIRSVPSSPPEATKAPSLLEATA